MPNNKSPFGHSKKDTDLHTKEGKSDLTSQERRFKVREASERYLKGEITEDALQKIENDCGIIYSDATFGVASADRGFRGWIKRVFGI